MDRYGKLAPFTERLRGGIYSSANDARPASFEISDGDAFRDWPGGRFTALAGIRRGDGDIGQLSVIEELAKDLRSNRSLLLAVLFTPDRAFDRLLTPVDQADRDKQLIDAWVALCWTAEAAWCAVRDGLSTADGFAEGDADFLRPLAARLRFLVLSEPMRWRGQQDKAWWGRKSDMTLSGGAGVLSRVFGPGSPLALAGRSQDARREWLALLNEYQSHFVLSQSRGSELERELRAVVFGSRSRPLCLSGKSLTADVPVTAQDLVMVTDVIDLHLLPRFELLTVSRLVLHADSKAKRWARRSLAVLITTAGVVAIVCTALSHVRLAALLAVVCYTLTCVGVLLPGQPMGPMWLLRMPAASTAGFVALMALMATGWLVPAGRDWWYAPLGLSLASLGYLLLEIRAHGVGSRAALTRSLGVWLAGAAHATLVSVIGIVVVAPAFTGNLARLWSHPGYASTGRVLALTVTWCLAVGVFSQILWDDRPITAPLAHMSWRGLHGLDDAHPAGHHPAVQQRRGPGRCRGPGRVHQGRDAVLVPRPGGDRRRTRPGAAGRAGTSCLRRRGNLVAADPASSGAAARLAERVVPSRR